MRKQKGFTLAELLIVVAIIAVLVAISIPIFNSQLEKARRAVDMQTARNIESVLVNAMNDGTVEMTSSSLDDQIGIWVLICRDKNSWPKNYGAQSHDTVFCGAENNVFINGVPSSANWNTYNAAVENILKQSGIDANSLKLKSKGGSDGWDWVVIEAGCRNNVVFSRIYSGKAGDSSSVKDHAEGTTNIEKQMG